MLFIICIYIYIRPMFWGYCKFQGILYLENMAKNMVLTYLHFRVLKFPLIVYYWLESIFFNCTLLQSDVVLQNLKISPTGIHISSWSEGLSLATVHSEKGICVLIGEIKFLIAIVQGKVWFVEQRQIKFDQNPFPR
jgi:hypothetical protein